MTATPQHPTDDELAQLWCDTPPTLPSRVIHVPAINFARVVLAKWGAPRSAKERVLELREAFTAGTVWEQDVGYSVSQIQRHAEAASRYPLPTTTQPRELVAPSGWKYRVVCDGGERYPEYYVVYCVGDDGWKRCGSSYSAADASTVADLLVRPTEERETP